MVSKDQSKKEKVTRQEKKALPERITAFVVPCVGKSDGLADGPVFVKDEPTSGGLSGSLEAQHKELLEKNARLEASLRELEEANQKLLEKQQRLILSETQARASNEAKSRFLAKLSHELRTPASAVVGMAEIMLDTALHLEQREYTEMIRDCAEGLLAILNDLLDLSRIEAGQLRVESHPFDLWKIVEGVADLFAKRAQEKGCELLFRCAPHVPQTVVGDVNRFRQILSNLLDNAIKFTDKGYICINVDGFFKKARFVMRLSVEDTGVGIPSEQLESIFQEFTQIKSASEPRAQVGVGLGLSICRQLASLMGGSLSASSAPGKGAVLSLELPLELHVEKEKESFARAALHGMRVLVVDGCDRVLSAICEQLSGSGVRCDTQLRLEGVLGSLSQVDEPPWEMMLIDLAVLRASGTLLKQRLGAMRGGRKIALVALHPVGAPPHPEDMAAWGVPYHMTKPVHLSSLPEELGQIKQQHKLCQTGLLGDVYTNSQVRMYTPARLKKFSEQKRILLVEDDPVSQRVAEHVLQKLGCVVDVVSHGRDAVMCVERQSYDLVLMDCQMPIMDGFEATQEIRRKEQGEVVHVPIIAMTAHMMDEDAQRCLHAGMDDYFAKPVRPLQMQEILDRWCREKKWI